MGSLRFHVVIGRLCCTSQLRKKGLGTRLRPDIFETQTHSTSIPCSQPPQWPTWGIRADVTLHGGQIESKATKRRPITKLDFQQNNLYRSRVMGHDVPYDGKILYREPMDVNILSLSQILLDGRGYIYQVPVLSSSLLSSFSLYR